MKNVSFLQKLWLCILLALSALLLAQTAPAQSRYPVLHVAEMGADGKLSLKDYQGQAALDHLDKVVAQNRQSSPEALNKIECARIAFRASLAGAGQEPTTRLPAPEQNTLTRQPAQQLPTAPAASGGYGLSRRTPDGSIQTKPTASGVASDNCGESCVTSLYVTVFEGRTICAGGSLSGVFQSAGESNTCTPPGFVLELSDGSGSFASPTTLATGGIFAIYNFLFGGTIPANTPAGSSYKLRIRTSNNDFIGPASGTFAVSAGAFTSAPSVSPSPVCAGQTVSLSFDATDCLKTGNTFTAQLSDKNGNFASPVSLGSVSPTVSNSLVIPASTPGGTGYKIRVVSSNAPALTSDASNAFEVKPFTFNAIPTMVSPPPVCPGSSLTITLPANHSTCPFPVTQTFEAQLSDKNGFFTSPTSLGAVVAGPNSVVIPVGTPAGSSYRIRIVGSNPSATTSPTGVFTVTPSSMSAPVLAYVPTCAGQGIGLTLSTPCGFAPGVTFTAQLSDKNGSFLSPVSLGSVTVGSNWVTIPGGTPVGNGYKIRVVSSTGTISPTSAAFKVQTGCSEGGNNRMITAESAGLTGLQVLASPNPAPEGKLRIQIQGGEGQRLSVNLFNLSGQSVHGQAIEKAQAEEVIEWDIARQPTGLYLLRVSGEKESRSMKVLH